MTKITKRYTQTKQNKKILLLIVYVIAELKFRNLKFSDINPQALDLLIIPT